jgi:hypothetical protein
MARRRSLRREGLREQIMTQIDNFNSLRLRLCVLGLLILFGGFGATVRAQHEQHDMQNMPGMNQPPPTPTPKQSPPTQTPQPTPTPMDMHAGHEQMPGMSADDMTHASESDVKELLTMTPDGQMSIRVGAQAHNFIPMGQTGSGTAWQPAAAPLNMWHWRAGRWLLMLHGDVKFGVNQFSDAQLSLHAA